MADIEQREDRMTASGNSEHRLTTTISELPGKSFGITVEFPMFLTMLGLALTSTPITNILMYRTCFHSLNHTESECKVFLSPDKTNGSNQLEEEVQKYLTSVSTVKSILESVIPAVLSFFLGVWSDTYGRKPLLVWPLLGLALSTMMTVVYSIMPQLGPWWYLLTAVPLSLSGGLIVLFTAAYCYLSDITSSKSRSLRMTLLQAAVSVGMVIGSTATPFLMRAVGPVYLLLIAAVIYVVSYAFTAMYLNESLTGAVKGSIWTVLDCLLVKEMFSECFKKRPNNGRAQILLLTVANGLSILILYGLVSLEYMYVRDKIHWALSQYTVYSAVSTTISFVGSMVGVAVIQRLLPISDMALIIIAFLSSIAEYVVRTLATVGWHMYLGASISLFKGLSAPLIRSLLTKILPVEDIAKVFALMCALEAFCPLVSPVVYNSLYRATISQFPGAIYVLSAALNGVCVIMMCFVQYYIWKSSSAPAYSPLQQS